MATDEGILVWMETAVMDGVITTMGRAAHVIVAWRTTEMKQSTRYRVSNLKPSSAYTRLVFLMREQEAERARLKSKELIELLGLSSERSLDHDLLGE